MSESSDPLELLAADRAQARDHNDGWAAVCTLATVNAEGDAEQRTLVLRELEKRLALFFSAHAPKWLELQQRPTCSIALYMPSVQVQYRIRAGWEKIEDSLVHASWSMRPDIPKKLDWFYGQHPQSTAIDRQELLEALADDQPVPETAPPSAMGIYLNPHRIERLKLSQGVHERCCWETDAQSNWRRLDLVP